MDQVDTQATVSLSIQDQQSKKLPPKNERPKQEKVRQIGDEKCQNRPPPANVFSDEAAETDGETEDERERKTGGSKDLVPASKLEESLRECDLLKRKVIQLQQDLQDAQDFVFSLQPRQKTLTESEAVEGFQALCVAVEEWVDQKLGDSLDAREHSEQPRFKDIQNLLDLIPLQGKIAFAIPGTDLDNIHATILRFLCDSIFTQDFYCPLPKEERELLTITERSMRTLQPRRDLRTCRHWRIETYSAIAERPGFSEYADVRMWNITVDIVRMLRVLVPKADTRKLIDSFLESITKPAFALARKMHLSMDEYTLDWSPYHETPPSPRTFDKEFNNFDFINIHSQKMVRERPNGELRWLFDITPKLVFRKLRADSWAEGKTLVRPKVLVAVRQEGESRKKERKVPPGQHPTVLAAMDTLLRDFFEQEQARREKSWGSGSLGIKFGW